MKKIRAIGLAALAAVWLVLVAGAWLGQPQDISETERRKLAQFPELTVDTVLGGKFMTNFEDYTLDQFPLRDTFRQIKALFHYNALMQKDNNGIYIADGYAAELEYPLDQTSVSNASQKLNLIYEKYLQDTGSKIILSVVPDKGYYLAEENGYPAMDYEALTEQIRRGTPWAEFVDITDLLTSEDYYFTDTHWRPAHQQDFLRRASDPPAHRHRGVLPD